MKNKTMLLNTDSYKYSMYTQYPQGTEYVHSYIEARRGGRLSSVVMFGLEMFVKDNLTTPITIQDVNHAQLLLANHGVPFYRERWEYIIDNHMGYLPIVIKALPEGTVCAAGTPMVTVENTDPNCFWLTTFVETALLRSVWYASTVATISHNIKKDISKYMKKTCETDSKLQFMLNDFGSRGVSSFESSAIGGLAHLLSFYGTDNIPAILAASEYYGATDIGFSIPAMEHSTVTSWGRDGEVDAFRNMLDVYGDKGTLLACVSDSYDLDNAVSNIWGKELKQEIIDSGATVVIRPDSGDPCTVVLRTLDNLGKEFGYTVNSKGYRVLNNVRVIQGDGIDADSINVIMEEMTLRKWSIDNIAFGMGGGLLQHCDRDWGAWAMKCSAIRVNGEWRDVFKQPKTDALKTSKKGRQDSDDMVVYYEKGMTKGMGPIVSNSNLQEIRSTLGSFISLL